VILRTVIGLAALSAVLIVTACSSTVSGIPSPDPRASSMTPSAGPQDALSALDSCTILEQLVAGQGFEAGVRKTARNECHVSKPEYGTLSLALDPQQGLADLETQDAGRTPAEINGRRALVGEPERSGMCEVGLGVTEGSRALVLVTLVNSDLYAQACPAARDLATKLEPLLPR